MTINSNSSSSTTTITANNNNSTSIVNQNIIRDNINLNSSFNSTSSNLNCTTNYTNNNNNTLNTSLNTSLSTSTITCPIPEDVVDDLCSRFIINIPVEERNDLIRVCFHVELAHWFYQDYFCAEQKSLPKLNFNYFAKIIFLNIPFLRQHVSQVDAVVGKWREYKMAVPTYGAILLDKELDNVLLVQGFWARSSWGFPKGKVNADEDPVVCAIREVYEETGYNCSSNISAKDYIELNIQDTLIRLYIVTGVDKETIFTPQTRCEIKSCSWFKISDLPMTRKDMVTKENKTLKPNAFFMAIPFVKPLKKWISKRKQSCAPTCITQEIFAKPSIVCIHNSQQTSNEDKHLTTTMPPLILTRDFVKTMTSANTAPLKQQKTTPKPEALNPFDTSPSLESAASFGTDRRRFWSSAWASVKIDWSRLLVDVAP